MKEILLLFSLIIVIFPNCGFDDYSHHHVADAPSNQSIQNPTTGKTKLINPEGNLLQDRILPPKGLNRAPLEKGSFGAYLRQLPLKPHGSEVTYFNGATKPNYEVYEAVVDLPIGKRDLHQCADAIMRLRAEHLWHQKHYDQIHFNFTNGFKADYSKWKEGYRIRVNNNDVNWVKSKAPTNRYQDFWKYLEIVFSYAGTMSLSKELVSTSLDELKIGDVFIQGGFPGHAVIVADIVTNPETGKKYFLLAQSYMPAQEIQILKNPNDPSISPWYSAEFNQKLDTPEWTFNKSDLKRFRN